MASPDQTFPKEGPRAADDPLAIEIDSARIAPDGWRTVSLPTLAKGLALPSGVSARFGWGEVLAAAMPAVAVEAAPSGNDNTPEEPAPQEEIAIPLVPEPDNLFVPRPPANDDSGTPRLRRIVRRRSLAEHAFEARDRADLITAEPLPAPSAPQVVSPMPVPAPIDWQAPRALPSTPAPQRLDPSAVTTLIVVMALIWSVGVGFAIYKLTVPGSGAPILWRK